MTPHNDSTKPGSGDYERPSQRYRCGRGVAWGKPCAGGPTTNGKCGGTSECQPVLQDGKWECRRPANAGGPCKEGPKAGGACSHSHPPCVPRLTLRARRGRLTWQFSVLLGLLLAAGFHFGTRSRTSPTADAGPLSAKHAGFSESQGCAACHAPHSTGPIGLAKAAFRRDDMPALCLRCHALAGSARLPHDHFDGNAKFGSPAETDCRICHTEHHGADAKLTTLTDAQCHICHQKKFQSFDRDHPAFPVNYPRVARPTVVFDHAKHLLEYFKQPENSVRAPQTCIECHAVSPGRQTVLTAGFESVCAACHADQIPKNELVLLRLPDPTEDADALTADDATAFMAWLLQRNPGISYGKSLSRLISDTASEGVAALVRELSAASTTEDADALLAGISSEQLARPAQLWMKQQKFEPFSVSKPKGWYWLEDLYPELRYRPTGHADAVAKAWTEFGMNLKAEAEPGSSKRQSALKSEIAQPRSAVGRCVKCHVIQPARSDGDQTEWRYPAFRAQPYTTFSHAAHQELVRCAECHVLNVQADYTGQFEKSSNTPMSNFKSIELPACTRCHAESKARNDCHLCHQYHRLTSLKSFAISK